MKKQTPKPDENQMAFNGLQELLRRDEERDKAKEKNTKEVTLEADGEENLLEFPLVALFGRQQQRLHHAVEIVPRQLQPRQADRADRVARIEFGPSSLGPLGPAPSWPGHPGGE